MQKLIRKLTRELELWLFRKGEVARFEGIILADLHSRKTQTSHFVDILLASLHLLKETDGRRFERVRRRLAWIVNLPLTHNVAQYRHHTRACAIDFIEPSDKYGREHLVAWNALILVHEATHGEIHRHGILYTPELRTRIERLCVREEHRFLTRLTCTHPDLAKWLYREFDVSRWARNWNTSPTSHFLAEIKRIFQSDKRG